MIYDWYGKAQHIEGGATAGEVVFTVGRTEAEQNMETKLVLSVPPSSLLPASFLDFLH